MKKMEPTDQLMKLAKAFAKLARAEEAAKLSVNQAKIAASIRKTDLALEALVSFATKLVV